MHVTFDTAISHHLETLFHEKCWRCVSLQLGDVGGGGLELHAFPLATRVYALLPNLIARCHRPCVMLVLVLSKLVCTNWNLVLIESPPPHAHR